MTRPSPCIPWDETAAHCVAGLLVGTSCCPHGDCALCEEQQERMRRAGRHELDVAHAWLRVRLARRDVCPTCGFPPPPAPTDIPPLPRLDRPDRLHPGSPRCLYCDQRIHGVRRRYCDDDCWRAYVVWSRGLERAGVARV